MLDLADLYRRQRAYVRGCLLSCGVPGNALEDAIQDVFLVLFRRADDFDPARGTVRAWLFGICLRVARKHRRKVGPAAEVDEQTADDAIPDPERYASRVQAASLADSILDSIPREQLSVLVMSDVEEMTGPEIAETLSLPLGTVHSRLARARRRVGAEVRRRRQDTGVEARPWFAVLAIDLRKAFSPGPLSTAAFVSMRTLQAMVIALGLAAAAAVLLWMRTDGKADDAVDDTPTATASEGTDAPLDPHRFGTGLEGSDRDRLTNPTSSISGTITEAGGSGVAAAQVCAWLQADDLLTPETRLPRCVKADGQGRYELRTLMPSRYRVTAVAKERLPGQYVDAEGLPLLALERDDPRSGVDIVLDAGGVALRGTVTDVMGGMIAGAVVTAKSTEHGNPITEGSWGTRPPVMTRTDDEGTFELWVRPGTLQLDASADGYAPGRALGLAPGLVASVVLAPESVLAGRVVDRSSGNPVEGARVSVGGEPLPGMPVPSTFTDAEGRFRLTGLEPGRYRPLATAAGRLGDAPRSVVLGLGETVEDITVSMIAAPIVTGRIVNADGDGCPQGVVGLQGKSSGRTLAEMTDGSGLVVFDAVLPDTYDVLVACVGQTTEGPPPTLTVADADVRDRTWKVVGGAKMSGRVLDASGAALADASISAYIAGPGAGPAHGAHTDANGGFTLTGLGPGSYTVQASHDEHGEGSKLDVAVAKDDVEVELRLSETGAIEGTVMDAEGQPQAGSLVRNRAPPFRTVVAKDDGSFRMAAMPAGTFSLMAERSAGDVSTSGSVTVTAGQTSELALTLPARSGTITGVVKDEDGDVVQDAIVTTLPDAIVDGRGREQGMRRLHGLAGFGRDRAPVLTDAEGRFEIPVFAEGTHTVLVQRRGGGETQADHVAAGSHVTLEIPALASISGRAVSSDGAGAKALGIRLRNLATGSTLTETFYIDDGAFQFGDLAAGTYELVATSEQGRARAEVKLSAGESVEDLTISLVGGVTVRGKVVDVTTGKPVEGMMVVIGPPQEEIDEFAAKLERVVVFQKKGHRTDESGQFELSEVPPGAVRVMVMSEKLGKDEYGMALFAMGSAGLEPVNDMEPIYIAPMPGGVDGEYVPTGIQFAMRGPWCSDDPTVSEVEEGSAAARAGVRKGDVITAVNGYDVTGKRCHLGPRLAMLTADQPITLTIDGKDLTIRAGDR